VGFSVLFKDYMTVTSQHEKEINKILAAGSHFKPKGAFIAGGALTSAFTNQPINDVDYYFKTKEAFMDAVSEAYSEMMWCVAATDRAVTFVYHDHIIQLMLFDFFPEAKDIFNAFDYTICMAAYDLDSKELIFHNDFLKHASQRHLSFHSGTRYPYGSLMRVLKYQSRGYSIRKGDLLRIALCCNKVEINSWDDLAAAIGGQYGEKAKIDTDVPFSMEAAIKLYEESPEITVQGNTEAMPGSAGELLYKLGLITEDKQEDYDW
jgi:hypothetical protein